MDLTGRSAVVLGASSGIGAAVARLLAAGGARVLGIARSAERLAALGAEIGPAFTHAALDARDATAFRDRLGAGPGFDHLVLTMNAGAATGAFRELELGKLRQAFENKFWPYVTALQAALPRLSAEGSVTLVTGVAATKPAPGIVGLAATNGALEAMVGTLALELAPIRVNAVSPGVTGTPYWDGVPPQLREAFFARAAAAVPLRRLGTAEEIARAVLAVMTNGFITGAVLPVDGGIKVS
jgi:NAD(P)-dependent dehydrogenase (short-subunit alcohol dehydrogenase family)